jgi:outer membrane lipoprotein carrier protein
MVRLRAAAAVTAALFLFSPARPFSAHDDPKEVAGALQTKYDRVRDFTADFTQHHVSILKRKGSTHRGKLQIKKPGKMRWDYTAPEKQLFVSDGRTIYLFVPADNQVTVSPVPQEDTASSAAMFLLGKGNIVRDFTVTFIPNAPQGTWGLRLQPRIAERDYDWLEVIADRTTMQIRQLTAANKQGGQDTFTLANFKENVGLSDKIFEFTIPRGADVIKAGASKK